jgi:thiopurine S-methyltransferase
MSNEDWRNSWRRNEIAFHQDDGNSLLRRFWPAMALPLDATILVPLCGKSRDLLWLAEQGHAVMGVELSPIAISAFFNECGLTPKRTREGRFTVWRSGRIAIFGGDFFDLAARHVADVALVYDRTSLTALPAERRRDYAKHMIRILPDGSPTLLLTTESPEGDIAPPPYRIDDEVSALYAATYDIALLHGEEVFEDDPDVPLGPQLAMEAKVYLLAPR